MRFRLAFTLVCVVFLLVLTSACAGDKSPAIEVESAWGRPSPMYPTAGGVYMLINNSGTASDTLLSASSPACGSIEFHKTVMKPDGSMGMELIDQPLEIPAGGQLELKPGDLHAMCIMKNEMFEVGNTIEMTLVFEQTGEKVISVEMRAE